MDKPVFRGTNLIPEVVNLQVMVHSIFSVEFGDQVYEFYREKDSEAPELAASCCQVLWQQYHRRYN